MSALGKAMERYFYDFSLHESVPAIKQAIPSRGKYLGLRHVAFCTLGLWGMVNVFFPFNPPFPTIGMCPNGWKGSWVCEADKHKALEMYKEWKMGVKPEHAH